MTPRLMHTKSRAGCTRCKTRKVKCDEGKPICGACQKHGVDCLYPDPSSPSSRTAPQRRRSRSPAKGVDNVSHSDSTSSVVIAIDTLIPGVVHDEEEGISLPESAERRLLELQMMQLYMRSFKNMFSDIHDQELVDIWQNAVPALALKSPFLLHAMFAITALFVIVTKGERRTDGLLHRSSYSGSSFEQNGRPSDRTATALTDLVLNMDKMEEVRVLYFNLAIAGHRKAIAQLNPSNADSICISTILISHSGFLLTHDFDPEATTYAPPVKWLWLASGIHTMISETTPVLGPDSAMMRIIQSVSGENIGEELKIPGTGAFFSPLVEFERNTESEKDLEIYGNVLSLMGMLRSGFLRDESSVSRIRKTFSFASLVPTEFITFVSEHRPRAIACLACFFAMAKENEHIWWFTGAAETHVLGLKSLLPDSWLPLMAWPLDIIGTPSVTKRTILWQQSKMTTSL